MTLESISDEPRKPAAPLLVVGNDEEQPAKRRKRLHRLLSHIPDPKVKSGVGGATINLINTIVGAGIIGIPYALKESGILMGLFLLLLVAYMTDKSLRLMVDAARFHPILQQHRIQTFEDLMFIPYGEWGSNFILINMLILAYGAMFAYLLIIKDTVPCILEFIMGSNSSSSSSMATDFVHEELVMFITSLLVILPLSLLRDMASLSFTSCLSVSADVVLTVFLAFCTPVYETLASNGGLWAVLKANALNSHLFIGLGIISTAMACQHSAFIVNGSLEEPSSYRWSLVTRNAIGFSAFLCCCLGTIGYLGFLDQTRGDILNNFEGGDDATMQVFANGARALLATTMVFTYPMESFVARHVLAKVLYNGSIDKAKDDDSMLGRREFLTIGIFIATLLPALYFDDVGPVLSITGCIGASCIAYIAPGLMYLGVHGDAFLDYVLERLQRADRHAKECDAYIESVELPLDGDRSAKPSCDFHCWTAIQDAPKPWWWWLGGFPIWCRIAQRGSDGMREFWQLDDQHYTQDCSSYCDDNRSKSSASTQVSFCDGQIGPRIRDYYISQFLILFGLLALVIGLASNFMVQMNISFQD